MIPLIGIVIGLLIGLLLDVPIPPALSVYIAVTALSALSSLMAAIQSKYDGSFEARYYLLSFGGNTLFALAITALGEQLNIPLSYVAFFAFGQRIFNTLNRLWKLFLVRHAKVDEEQA